MARDPNVAYRNGDNPIKKTRRSVIDYHPPARWIKNVKIKRSNPGVIIRRKNKKPTAGKPQ